jgi:hypothetical protein
MASTSITGAFDAVVVYQLIKMLATPWEETDAFKLGIIDKDGKVLRKRKTLKTQEEKNAFTVFHVLTYNLKKLLEKLPFGKSKLASFAAALILLREMSHDGKEQWEDEEWLETQINKLMESADTKFKHLEYQVLEEEVSASATTTADVALKDKPLGKKKKFETETFAGNQVFVVDQERFQNARMGKSRFHRWSKYVGEDDLGLAIREYGIGNPGKPIILKNSATGSMLYLRYGRG